MSYTDKKLYATKKEIEEAQKTFKFFEDLKHDKPNRKEKKDGMDASSRAAEKGR